MYHFGQLSVSCCKYCSKKQSIAGRDCEKPRTDVELFAWLVLCVYSPQLLKRGCGGGREVM